MLLGDLGKELIDQVCGYTEATVTPRREYAFAVRERVAELYSRLGYRRYELHVAGFSRDLVGCWLIDVKLI